MLEYFANRKQEKLNKELVDNYDKPAALAELIAKGADVNAKTGMGSNIIILMARDYYIGSMQLLLENHADPDVQGNQTGNTPLHYVVQNQSLESVELLLRYKAALNIKNNDGETPIILALRLYQKSGNACYRDMLVLFKAEIPSLPTMGKVENCEISFIEDKPDLKQHITRTFNFSAGFCRELVYCQNTKSQSHVIIPFEQLQGTKFFAQAEEQYIRQGGRAYDFKKRLDKS